MIIAVKCSEMSNAIKQCSQREQILTTPDRLIFLGNRMLLRNGQGRRETQCLHTGLRAPALEKITWSIVGIRPESLSKSDRESPTRAPGPVGSRAGPATSGLRAWDEPWPSLPLWGMKELDQIHLVCFLFFSSRKASCQI